MPFNAILTCPIVDTNYPIDGVDTIAKAGKRYFLVSENLTGWKLVSEISFDDSGNFSSTFNIDGRVFTLELGLQSIQPYFEFSPVLLEDKFSFEMEESFVKSFFSDNGVSDGGFTVPDLDGNFGALPNGSIVNVSGIFGDYTVVASQQLWSFPASEYQSSCVIYKLVRNGKILIAPQFLVTLKPEVSN